MLRLYNIALLPLRLVVALRAAWQSRDPGRRREWTERRAGSLPLVDAGGVWIHGSSVGEARIVAELARSVRARLDDRPLLVSAFTTTGRDLLPRPPVSDAAFLLPLDFRAYVRRLHRHLQPALLALVETEIWPNLLHEARRRHVPVVLVNGRLSAQRMGRYRRFAGLYRPALRGLWRIGAQSADDAGRFEALGVDRDRIDVTGNVKFDLPLPDGSAAELRRRVGLSAGRPVFVAGSTAEGEDAAVVDALLEARRDWPELYLVLAPRHPPRADAVETLLRSRGLVVRRWSVDPDDSAGGSDVLLVDVVGQLGALYRLADVAFVGGSLVPLGGHNVLEPAAVGVPVLFGTHTDHFSEPAALLERREAGRRVASAAELGAALRELLGDPERRRRMGQAGEEVLKSHRGALARSTDLLLSALPTAGDGVSR